MPSAYNSVFICNPFRNPASSNIFGPDVFADIRLDVIRRLMKLLSNICVRVGVIYRSGVGLRHLGVSQHRRKILDGFLCAWFSMIGEMHELIDEYLGNGPGRDLLITR